MQSVTVLTPHGRRQVVKVETNKTVLSILEEVCKKFNFDPNSYDLKHHNKLLDLSQMFRFASLPNNATLEMVEAEKKRVEQNLVICLQLEDGTRINGNFPSSATLREIINALSPEKASEDQSPVVIYMRSELFGDALDKTSLKDLGLSSGGRALLRLVNTNPENLKVQANVSAPLPQKPKEEVEEVYKPKRQTADIAGPSGLFEFKDVKQLIPKPDPVVSQAEPEKMREEPMEVEEVPVNPREVEPKYEQIEERQQEPEPEPVINVLDSRGTIIFSLDTMKTSQFDLPDSFFDLTESEVRKLYRDLKNQVEDNENKPLMTTELRKLEENKKILNQLSIYKSCAIRIQMPNRFVIQSKFSTVETIGVVMDFVRKFLIDPEIDFHLFITPPKKILDKNETLIESNCVPSALLHFGSSIVSDNFLKPELFEKLSTGSGASRVLSHSEGQPFDQASSSNGTNKKPMVPQNFMPSKNFSNEATGAVPKWFKKGK